MNRILSSLTLMFAWMLMGTEVSLMGSTFYVDPDYTGGGNDGSAAHPWISVVSNNWTVINGSLATNGVTVYFSALKTNGTTQQSQAWFLEVKRRDTSTNRLTLDGYSFYNTNRSTASWRANPNASMAAAYTNHQVFGLTSDGSQALGWSRDSGNDLVTRSGTNYRCIKSHTSDSGNAPGTGTNWQRYWVANRVGGSEWASSTAYSCYVKQDNVTLRGFECSGTASRVGFSGDNFLIDCVWVHDLTIGASITLLYTTADDATNVLSAPSTNITIRNIRVENSRDEGLYLGAINPDSPEAIQCAQGNQYDQVTVSNFFISGAGTRGGQGDGIDCKNGITNLHISDGEIKDGHGTMGGIICPQTFTDADQAMLVERVYIHGLTNGTDERRAIYMLASSNSLCFKGYNGITVRNCIISDCKAGIVCSSGIPLKNIKLYNNTIYNITDEGIVPDSTDGTFEVNSNLLQSNIMAWEPSPDPAVVGYYVHTWAEYRAADMRFDVGLNTQVSIFGLKEGLTYYFLVTAYDAAGVESAPLVQASYVVPVPTLLVQGGEGLPGGAVTVPVRLISVAGENALSFSLAYDTNVLSFASAANGSAASDAAFSVTPGTGHVGISLARPAGVSFTNGQYEVALLTFNIAPGTNTLATALTFADQPVVRLLRAANAVALPSLYVAGGVVVQASGSMTHSIFSTLFTQVIRIGNPANAGGPVNGVRVWLYNLGVDSKRNPIQVQNATGVSNGVPYIDYSAPLTPGQSVNLTVQYYVADRITIPHPHIVVEFTGLQTVQVPEGTTLTPAFRFVDGTGVVEFPTLAGHTYYVEYAADVAGISGWKTALPTITGTGAVIQWIDDGPPKTENSPADVPSRFYRVLLVP